MEARRASGPALETEALPLALLEVVRSRLRIKVIAPIVAVLIAGFAVLVIVSTRRESVVLIETNLETARLLAASIVGSIESGMLEARPDVIRRLVRDLRSELRDVRRLEVYRTNGVEAFADLETLEKVDRLVRLDADVVERIRRMRREPGVRIAHPLFTQAVEAAAPRETYETLDGMQVLTLFRPLPNLRRCQACHGADHQVRGVVRISLGLDKLEAELQAARNRQLAIAGLTILALAGTVVAFLGRVVLAPIARVAAVARRIGGDDLAARVAVTSRDEIGELGRAINDMADGLARARGDLESRNAELAAALRDLKASMEKVELLEQVKGELAKFVPESVKRLLEKNPDARELEKREVDVSVLFLDVEGYTRLAEQLPPQRLNRLIQDYFSSFLEVIRAHEGDVNETAGDGLMVIFQSEGQRARHALNAAATAFEILGRVAGMNRDFEGIYPPVAIHVGINSGPALVGATKLESGAGGRWTFTASGPTTNLAARIAGLTKGGEVKVGPETAERIKDQYVLQDTGEHQLKNVSQPVRVYRLVPAGVYRVIES